MKTYGLLTRPAKGRDLFSIVEDHKYVRYPISTPVVKIGDDLYDFIAKYGKPYFQKGDVFCISAKVVSIALKLVLHESEVKPGLLSKFIVKFVTKYPDDIGYSHPRKMQAAINIVGYPRAFFALGVGTFMKVLGKPGYFYKIAGHNINAIDGFNPVSRPPMNEYAVLPPPNSDEISDKIEKKFGMPTVILDGNNIDNNVLGMSKAAKALYSVHNFQQIVKGNPQGQEDDGNVTPMMIVREVKK